MQPSSITSPISSFRSLLASFANSARFWEPHRIPYNLALTGILATWFLATWPHFRPAMTPFHLFQFFMMGVMANVCYTLAYVADFGFQRVFSGGSLLSVRWALWILGTLLAMLFESYWIVDEIYPYVR